MAYFEKALAATGWMGALRITGRAVSIGKMIVLARILSPDDFGVFGAAVLALGFMETALEAGTAVFLLQEKDKISKYADTVLTIDIFRGFLLTALLVSASPFLARLLNAEGGLMLFYLVSFSPFIKGFINPYIIKFQSEMKFNREFNYRIAVLLAETAVVLTFALLSPSSLSLAAGLIAAAVAETALSYILISDRPRFKLCFDHAGEVIKRGKWLALTGLVNFAAAESDNAAVVRYSGTGSLGIYQMAFKIAMLPASEIGDSVNKAVLPVYAAIAGDKRRALRAYIKTVTALAVAVFFCCLGLYLSVQFLIPLLLGVKWLPAIPLIRILLVYVFCRTVFGHANTLFLGWKKQNYTALMTAGRLITLLIFLFPLTTQYGPAGTAGAVALSGLAELPLGIVLIAKLYIDAV